MKEANVLFKLFEQYAYGQNYSFAFSELLDCFLITFKFYTTVEEQEKALEILATHKKKDLVVDIFTEVGELAEGFQDPLGNLYERMISKGQHGQYFTPEPIASFMAATSVTPEMLSDNTVLDPACGSGRMLLAVAKINRYLPLYGADIDLLCCKMSLVNMLLHSLRAEICHMNSLSNEFYKGYRTDTILKDNYHHPYYREIINKEDSFIWKCQAGKAKSPVTAFTTPFNPTRPEPIEGVQGTLFD